MKSWLLLYNLFPFSTVLWELASWNENPTFFPFLHVEHTLNCRGFGGDVWFGGRAGESGDISDEESEFKIVFFFFKLRFSRVCFLPTRVGLSLKIFCFSRLREARLLSCSKVVFERIREIVFYLFFSFSTVSTTWGSGTEGGGERTLTDFLGELS